MKKKKVNVPCIRATLQSRSYYCFYQIKFCFSKVALKSKGFNFCCWLALSLMQRSARLFKQKKAEANLRHQVSSSNIEIAEDRRESKFLKLENKNCMEIFNIKYFSLFLFILPLLIKSNPFIFILKTPVPKGWRNILHCFITFLQLELSFPS